MLDVCEISNTMKSRESFYLFLSRIYEKELSEEFIQQLKGLPFSSAPARDLDAGCAQIAEYLKSADSNVVDDLAVDFAKIFLAAGESKGNAAFPYESVYTSHEKIVMQEAHEVVTSVYAAKGLRLETSAADIKEDHIAMELNYMAVLCSEFKTENADFCLKEQYTFLKSHLLNWLPEFCNDINEYARTDFYKGVAKLTLGFLNVDSAMLEELTELYTADSDESFSLDMREMDIVLSRLKQDYKICTPKLMEKRGPKGQEIVRYGEINSIREIVNDRKSDFSAKEVYYPIMQTMLKFTDVTCEESQLTDDKAILLFVRPCDINAMGRLDTIFNLNGGNADLYYKRLRDKVKIVMLECKESFENCFCVSMGSNRSDDYSMAIRIGDVCQVQIKDITLKAYFSNASSCGFVPEFVTENEQQAILPVIENKEALRLAASLEFWNKFDEKCIACGGCNTVCPTCSCFDTVDIIYDETSREGERRRVWSSCMLSSFTMTAGGNRARATNGASMRFKTLHKVYDYQKRFDTEENMCIGCGRCISRCPEDISFLDTINEFRDELEKAKAQNLEGGR